MSREREFKMNSEALIVAQGVNKTFKRRNGSGVTVLKDLDFEVSPGQRVAILGKSGTGKSTLLHILGTLERPTSGRVFFLGRDIFRFDERRLSEFRNRELGFVFQFHYLMLEFNALENVLMPALIAGESRRTAVARATALLDRVGLGDRWSHRPSELSGGEQQRVAIARALMMKPKLLLTDEMTGNLDPRTGQQIFDLVYEIHTEYRLALISVTHDEQLAAEYNQIYRLTDGKLRREGIKRKY